MLVRARQRAGRAGGRVADRYIDVELRQLRAIQRAYSAPHGPEVLVFGDSSMFWTAPTDDDARRVIDMIRDELGTGVGVVAAFGAGYHARLVLAFLAALERCRSRPRVVVVPTAVLLTSTAWLNHPDFNFVLAAGAIRKAAETGSRPRRVGRAEPEVADAYDRRPAPSLVGAERTLGELRMLIHAKAETKWQKSIRLQHRFDYYNGERFDDETEGIVLTRELGRKLTALELPSVAYIMPVNHEDLVTSMGEAAHGHVARNAELITSTFCEAAHPLGTMVDATFDAPARHFIDPLHLGPVGRRHLAARIVAAVRPHLAD